MKCNKNKTDILKVSTLSSRKRAIPVEFEREFRSEEFSKKLLESFQPYLEDYLASGKAGVYRINKRDLFDRMFLGFCASLTDAKKMKRYYVYYSLNKNCYRGSKYSYNHMKLISDCMKDAGIIKYHNGVYSKTDRMESRGRFSVKHPFYAVIRQQCKEDRDKSATCTNAVVILHEKNANGKSKTISYRETKFTSSLTEKLTLINHFNYKAKIEYLPSGDGDIGRESVEAALCTVFNKVKGEKLWTCGGRLYTTGPMGYLNKLTRAERKTITIDSAETVEPDFKALHPCMLYALEGRQWDLDKDPYVVFKKQPKKIRSAVKLAFNALINAQNKNSAVKACNYELSPKNKTGGWKNEDACREANRIKRVLDSHDLSFSAIIARIRKVHRPIAKYFESGIGLHLQNIDGKIALEICYTLATEKIVVLPVHDSFIVQKPIRDELVILMKDTYSQHMNGFKIAVT